MHRFTVTRGARFALASALVLTGALGLVGSQWTPPTGPAPAPAQVAAGEPAGERYIPGNPSGGQGESQELLGLEDYWNARVTYPTGKYDATWLLRAAAQDKAIANAVPAGKVTYNKASAASSLSLDPNSWTALGPQPLQSNGCTGCYSYGHVSGRVNSIAVDPTTPNVAYLATVGGGIWKTTTCCAPTTTWAPATDDPLVTTLSVDHVVVDPSNHNNVYAGTGDLNFGSFSMGSAGVLKSTDAGATWTVQGANIFNPIYPQPAGQYPQYQAVGKVGVDPRTSNNVVAGTKTGVYFSHDGGTNWQGPCLPDTFSTQRQDVTGLILNNNAGVTDIYVAVGARGYSTTVQVNLAENGANGIYKTQMPASGCPATWTLSSRPDNGWPAGTGSGTPVYQGGDTLGRIDLAVAPSNPNYIYAQVQAINGNRGGQLGVWRTTDGGVTWAQRSGVSGLTGCAGDYPQNWYDQGMAVDPNNPDILFMDTFDIWKSTNGGTTFVDVTCGYNGGNTVHVDQHALAYVPGSSSVLLAGSDGGSYVTTNADAATPAFSQLNDTLNTIEFYSGDITANFATSASPGINAGAQDNGSAVNVWSGTPTANMWQLRKGGDGMFARIEPVLGQRWYQESQNGSLAVSTTGPYGAQVSATGGWTADTLSFVFPYEIYKYDCPPTGCQNMIAGSNRVWQTQLGGIPRTSWVAVSPNLTKQTLADRSFINQLSFSVTMSNTAIVGTNDGNVQYGFGPVGANLNQWVDVTGGNAVLPNRPILDVATDAVNPLIGYAAVGGFNENTPSTPGHVYMVTCTANCGSFTWANKSGNLPNIPIDSIIANPRYPQQVFAGSDWGVYYTNDITAASPVWNRFGAGMPNTMIWDLAIDRGFTTLAAFTRGRGAYAWPLSDGPIGGTATPTPTGQATATSTAVASATATAPASATVAPSQTATTVASQTAAATATRTSVTTATRTVPAGSPTATATPCNITFSDVHPTDYFYTPVQYLACHGVISGYADGTFRPYNETTRSQMVKIVVLAFNIAAFTPSNTNTFADVPPANPFFGVIEAAAHANIVSGYACGTAPGEPCDSQNRPYFRPFANVTRGQLSKIVVVAAGWTQINPATQSFQDVFPNTAFYTFVETAYCHGIISGYDCGGPGEPCGTSGKPYFRQFNNATRGQIAKIVYGALTTSTVCAVAPAK
jgi:hypothetical protein